VFILDGEILELVKENLRIDIFCVYYRAGRRTRGRRDFALSKLVSFAAVIRVVTHRSSPLTAAHLSSTFLSLCYLEPITCMYLLAARQSYFSLHLPPGFQKMEACSLLANLRKGLQSSSEQPLIGSLRDDPNNGCEGDYE